MNLREKYQIPADSVITIAGTVGVGKSTMTAALAKALDFKTSYEKVDTNPYLENFYLDFKRWSFHLQIYFLAERFKEQQHIFKSGGGFVQDRSIYEDTGIFAKMHYDNGTMSEIDYHTYTSLFDAMTMTPFFPRPDVLLYLEGSYEDIISRINNRGRQMEKDTPHEYWEELYSRYEKWINEFTECPILRIDIRDYDLMKNAGSVEPVLAQIGEIINKSCN